MKVIVKARMRAKNLASLDVESCHKCYAQNKGTQDSPGNKSVNVLRLLSMRLFVTLCTKRHAIYRLPMMIGSKYDLIICIYVLKYLLMAFLDVVI